MSCPLGTWSWKTVMGSRMKPPQFRWKSRGMHKSKGMEGVYSWVLRGLARETLSIICQYGNDLWEWFMGMTQQACQPALGFGEVHGGDNFECHHVACAKQTGYQSSQQEFKTDCLTSLISFYDPLSRWGRGSGCVYLGFCEASDTISHTFSWGNWLLSVWKCALYTESKSAWMGHGGEGSYIQLVAGHKFSKVFSRAQYWRQAALFNIFIHG